MHIPEPLRVLDVRLHPLTLEQTLKVVEDLATGDGRHHLATVNTEFVMWAQRDVAFRGVLNSAVLCTPDGIGVVWAGRLLGRSVPERVTGVGIVEHFAGVAARRGISIYLLGAGPGVAQRAAQTLQQRYRGLRIAGTYGGSPRPEDAEEILARIAQARPDVLFVAYGSPQQELWIARYRERLYARVCIGVGGSFDFIAGVVPRAPKSMQRAGLEWLFRLMRQPSRWRRMMALPGFVIKFLISVLLADGRSGPGEAPTRKSDQTPD